MNFSPTGYWANYTTRFKKADGSTGNSWTDCYPIVDIVEGEAAILDETGRLVTVSAHRDALAEGGDRPDEENELFVVRLEVEPHPHDGE